MPRQDSRQTFSRLFSLTLLAGGLMVPSGCAQRPGGEVAFRRFWGFERQGQDAASPGSPGHASGLFPKLLGQPSPEGNEPQDPFLAQEFGAAGESQQSASTSAENDLHASAENASESDKAPGPSVQTLFDAPPIHSSDPAEGQASSTEGNPFRLMEHQGEVADVSSADKKLQPPVVIPQQNPSGPSQLDRLKNALSQDAQNPKPAMLPADNSEVNRQRMEAMMITARRQMQQGEYDTALKWARAADQLTRRTELFFGPDEESPADLVRILEDRLKGPAAGLESAQQAPRMPIVQARPLETPSLPTLSIEFPEEEPLPDYPKESFLPEVTAGPTSLPHSTQAMKQAVIAPETVTRSPEVFGPVPAPAPSRLSSPGSQGGPPSGEPVWVGVNQGAAVSVDGPLDPPIEPPLPPVPLAPPAMEISQLPPFTMARNEPAKSSLKKPLPPLASPSATEATSLPQANPPETLNGESAPPAPTTLKNVDWEEADEVESAKETKWWILPACVLAGLSFVCVMLLKRKRA